MEHRQVLASRKSMNCEPKNTIFVYMTDNEISNIESIDNISSADFDDGDVIDEEQIGNTSASFLQDFPEKFDIINKKPGLRHIKVKKNRENFHLTKFGNIRNESSKNLPCEKCDKTFRSLNLLNRHKKEHKPNKCQFYKCSESFNLSENLRIHLAMHNKQLKQCPECKKSFKRFATLQGHLQTHYKSEYYSCDFCEEIFLNQEILRIHIRTKHAIETKKEGQSHVTEKRVKDIPLKNICQYCKKVFLKPSQLVRHLRIHTKEKPYKCLTCEKSFSQKNSLDTHSLIHSTDKMPHPCPQCPLSFRQKCNLKIHIKRVHSLTSSDELKYPCQQCSCIFKKLGALNAHIGKIHTTTPVRNEATEILDLISQISQVPKPSVADEIIQQPEQQHPPTTNGNVYIKLADRLENGVVIHRTVKQHIINDKKWFQCSYCPKQFTRPSDLLRHLRVHTREKPYECPWQNTKNESQEVTVLCKRRFATKSSLTVHMKTHENIKKQTCSICLETFTNSHSLQVHSKIHSVYDCKVCHKSYDKEEHNCQKMMEVPAKDLEVVNAASNLDYQIQFLNPLEVTENGIFPTQNKKQKIDDPLRTVKRFGCNDCGMHFKKSSHLKQHMSNHAGIRAHKCNICKKSFTTKNALNTHLKVHEQKSYSCSVCSTLFSTAGSLRRHSLNHTEEKNFLCPYCKKSFKSVVNCRKHIKTHKNEIITQLQQQKPEEIILENQPNEILDLIPTDQIPMQELFLVSNDITSFQGPLDNFILTTSSKDDYEMDIQSNNTPIKYVLVVDGNFVEQTDQEIEEEESSPVIEEEQNITDLNNPVFSILKNIQIISNEESNFEEEGITQLWILNDKIDENDPGQNNSESEEEINEEIHVPTTIENNEATECRLDRKCNICGKQFKKPIDLRRHVRTHTREKPFTCEICSKSFALLSTLKSHLKTHGENKQLFSCQVCSKQFTCKGSLTVHLRIHTASKPYGCPHCSLSFRTTGHRQSHIKAHLKEAQKKGVDPKNTKTRNAKNLYISDIPILQE